MWQKIDARRRSCHWWPKPHERRITAMTEILSDALAVVLLPGGLLALVRYARRDVFAGPGIGHDPGMEPGALDLAGLRRRRR
jgi:hypothetical protein